MLLVLGTIYGRLVLNMSNRRIERINELLREEISLLIMTEVKDPRISDIVTIVAVDTSPDFRRATIHFSSLDNESDREMTSAGLNSSAGFLPFVISSA